MLIYSGHIELPVCDWMGKNTDCDTYEPEMRTYNVAGIHQVGPIPANSVYPPAGEDRCWIKTNDEGLRVYVFLSYQEVCERINTKVEKLCGATTNRGKETRTQTIQTPAPCKPRNRPAMVNLAEHTPEAEAEFQGALRFTPKRSSASSGRPIAERPASSGP